jgi:hypothetical protein
MSDRPSAVNGKRNRAWGTRDACPACGQCLCFGCHPAGPCVDERDGAAGPSGGATYRSASSASSVPAGWHAPSPNAAGAAGLRMRSGSNATDDRLS